MKRKKRDWLGEWANDHRVRATLEKGGMDQVVFNEVYVPAFVAAAKKNGLALNTKEEIDEALEVTALLRKASGR